MLRGLLLKEALDWLKKQRESFSAKERHFVLASRTHTIKFRAQIGVLAILGLVLIGGPVAWLKQSGMTVPYAWSIMQARLHMVEVHEPEMVKIPGGIFELGDISGVFYNSTPLHEVTIRPFNIGRYEVTFEEYDRYSELIGISLPTDDGSGRGRGPVVNVTWRDAVAYASWLSKVTGKSYRLPTEAEWEYAARSGGKPEVWAGISEENELRNFAVYWENSGKKSAEVGSKRPNGLGLYDMSGNVWEWVQDCDHNNYDGAPADGSAWLDESEGEPDCYRRIIRGGSLSTGSSDLRTWNRTPLITGDRATTLGFRIAQDIPPSTAANDVPVRSQLR